MMGHIPFLPRRITHRNKPWTTIHNISPLSDGLEIKTFSMNYPQTDNPRYEMCGLRPSYYKLDRDLYLKAKLMPEILYWDQNTQFCGVCGGTMKMHTDISKDVPCVAKRFGLNFPTAIIVLIKRGDEVLLVHANNFRGNFFGLVAGFVETGRNA